MIENASTKPLKCVPREFSPSLPVTLRNLSHRLRSVNDQSRLTSYLRSLSVMNVEHAQRGGGAPSANKDPPAVRRPLSASSFRASAVQQPHRKDSRRRRDREWQLRHLPRS